MKKQISYLLPTARVKIILLVGFLILVVCSYYALAQAQPTKPRMKIGAYFFAGWAGKNLNDDGTPEHMWAKGMPTHVTKSLTTEFSGRTPIWGWRDDTKETMERQIDLAADNGVSFFSFCWYWADNKGPINVAAIQNDSKHIPMSLFMQAKNNDRMEFCLLVANHDGFEIVGEEAWRQAADYWIKIFSHPRYLRIDGKPLLIIFLPDRGNTEGFAYLQSAAKKAGFSGVAIAGCGEGKPISCCNDTNPEHGYLYRTLYNRLPSYRGVQGADQGSRQHPYSDMLENMERLWHGSPEQRCLPLAMSGWDKRPWEGPDGKGKQPGSYFDKGKTPEAFGGCLEKMVQWMDAHPEQITKDRLALIYAWNELGEGGWLVPTRDDPEGAYLKAIRHVVLGK
jgi:hypothetical protein